MKKSIPFLALLFFFFFACNKGEEPQTAESQSAVAAQNDGQAQAEDRAVCCCNVSVTSTAFAGLIICGVSGMGTACSFTPGMCPSTCGVQQAITPPNKNGSFCYDDDCTICFTNPSLTTAIQIRLDCGIGTVDLPPNTTKCFVGDCNGNFFECQ